MEGFQIKGEVFPEAYIIAFSNVSAVTSYPTYATIGTSAFKDTRRSIQTVNILVTYVDSGEDFQTFLGMKYRYVPQGNRLLVVNDQNFSDFLVQEKGQIVLSDIIPYDLGCLLGLCKQYTHWEGERPSLLCV